MTENRRIVLNTLVTYGRSVIGVFCGIFSTRWVLEALGQVDFGLYGLVGSMAIFIVFLNIQFSGAIARYYAYSIGVLRTASDKIRALEECRAWFSVAVLIHLVLPFLLVVIGYPIGVYAIEHNCINVPPERACACIWLWRFVCLSCFVGMVNVPFQAMYTAKQYIAELTIYSFAQTIFRTAFIYYMVCNPQDWLIKYGLIMALVGVIPEVIICVRACIVFPECRLRIQALQEYWRIAKLGSFAFWQGVGGVGFIASHQGMSILVNNAFGPRVTGAFSIAQTVSGEAASLTGALQMAISPAITTAYGAGEKERMRSLAYRVCRYGTLLTLFFAVPMAMEIDKLLEVWLKNPPPYASEMCVCALAFIVIEKLSIGHTSAVNAAGRVALFQICRGLFRVSVLPIAFCTILFKLSAGVTTLALPVSACIVVACDVILARKIVEMSIVKWIREVLTSNLVVCCVGVLGAYLVQIFMEKSLMRLIGTTLISLVAMSVASWIVLIQKDEREILRLKVRQLRTLVVGFLRFLAN